jgi:hypothetical protein
MPSGDRTGPRGQGPMGGREPGWCRGAGAGGRREAGTGPVGTQERGPGNGRRQRYGAMSLPAGAGSGRRSAENAGRSSWSPQEELDYLKDYTQGLEEAINAAKARMVELQRITPAE